MVVGGGAVGVEIAGEIAQEYPEKTVTVVHAGDMDSLVSPDTTEKLRTRVRDVLESMKITLILGKLKESIAFVT